jgi:hypothetical protein
VGLVTECAVVSLSDTAGEQLVTRVCMTTGLFVTLP